MKKFKSILSFLVSISLLISLNACMPQERVIFTPKRLSHNHQFHFNTPFEELNIAPPSPALLKLKELLSPTFVFPVPPLYIAPPLYFIVLEVNETLSISNIPPLLLIAPPYDVALKYERIISFIISKITCWPPNLVRG